MDKENIEKIKFKIILIYTKIFQNFGTDISNFEELCEVQFNYKIFNVINKIYVFSIRYLFNE